MNKKEKNKQRQSKTRKVAIIGERKRKEKMALIM